MELKDYETKLKQVANDNKHRFIKRSNTQIELVRMMGDIIDSRFDIKKDGTEVECEYTFTANDTTKSKTIFEDVTDYKFIEQIEAVMKQSNKDFEKACIDEDENPNDW